MATLVTLQQAKDSLRIKHNDRDVDIYEKLVQASDIVLVYIDERVDAGWSDGSVAVPGNVRAATLQVLLDLDELRPIDWDAVRNLLWAFRDPALA